MEVTALNVKDDGAFKLQKMQEDVNLKIDDFSKLVICAKSCDGSYHSVNSEIAVLLGQYRHLLETGNLGFIVGKLSPDEGVHGQRYVVFKKNEKEAFLLGTVVSALKKISESTR